MIVSGKDSEMDVVVVASVLLLLHNVVIDRVKFGGRASSSDVGDGIMCRPVEGLAFADAEGGLKTTTLLDTSKLAFVFQSKSRYLQSMLSASRKSVMTFVKDETEVG